MKFSSKFLLGAMSLGLAATFATPALAVPSVTVGAVTAIEGIPGRSTRFSVPITLSEPGAADVSVTVNLNFSGATASAFTDVFNRTVTTVVPAGQTSGTALFTLRNDNSFEGTEMLRSRIVSVTGAGAVIGSASQADIIIRDDDVPPGALLGSVGTGVGATRTESNSGADLFDLSDFVLNSGGNNVTSLGTNGSSTPSLISIDANGRPTTQNLNPLRRGTFTRPAAWPPASATDATSLPLPPYIVNTIYSGAFRSSTVTARADGWDQGWTVAVNGNQDVWDFNNTGGALNGRTAPVANGSCPAGTTLVGPFSTVVGNLANDEEGLFTGAAAAGDYDVCRLPRRVMSNLTLTNDNVYEIADGFPGTYIGNGEGARTGAAFADVTITVQQGTLVYGEPQEAFLVTRGSRIVAPGTAEAPVVFTSKQQLQGRFDGNVVTPVDGGRGEWAGLALFGEARVQVCPNGNFANCDVPLEGNVGNFGGNDDNDDSGTLRYVVIRGAGNDVSAGNGNELNGLTLGGVGRATRVQYVQIHRGLDDGIEFFGGNVFVANLVLTENADDSFDYAQGWTGGAQFVYIIMPDVAIGSDPRMIEAGDSTVYAPAVPETFPLLANFTGLGPANLTPNAGQTEQGVYIRGGIRTQIHNSVFTGNRPESCLDIDANATFARANEAGGTAPNAPGPHLRIVGTVFDCTDFNFDEDNTP